MCCKSVAPFEAPILARFGSEINLLRQSFVFVLRLGSCLGDAPKLLTSESLLVPRVMVNSSRESLFLLERGRKEQKASVVF